MPQLKTANRLFPDYENQVRTFVGEHAALPDGPVHLALYYAPGRDPADVFVLEVLGNFGSGYVDEDKQFFEVAYPTTPAFRMPAKSHLRLVLTSPKELRIALKEQWPDVQELREAIRGGRYAVILADEWGEDFLRTLR